MLGLLPPKEKHDGDFVGASHAGGFDLENEGNFTECLSIGTEEQEDETLHLFWKGLLKKIAQTMKTICCNPNLMLANEAALGSQAHTTHKLSRHGSTAIQKVTQNVIHCDSHNILAEPHNMLEQTSMSFMC